MIISPGGTDEIVRRPQDVGHPRSVGGSSKYWSQAQSYTATCEANVDPLKTGYPITVTIPPREYFPPTTLAQANAAALAEATATAISQLSCCLTTQAAVVRVYDTAVSPWVVTHNPQAGASTNFSGSGVSISYEASTNAQFGPLGVGGISVSNRFVNTGRAYWLRYQITGSMLISAYGGVTLRLDIDNNATPMIAAITQLYDRNNYQTFVPIIGQVLIPTTCNTISLTSSISTSLGFNNFPNTQIASGSFQLLLTPMRAPV